MGMEILEQINHEGLRDDIPRFDPANNPSDGVTYPGGMVPNPWGESGYKRSYTTKCTQCHSAIHGTDLPSQTLPGGGDALMR